MRRRLDAAKMLDTPVRFFSSAASWRTWLKKNHEKSAGIWLRFFKKDSGKKSMVYAEALDEALCFGWIDGQSKSEGALSWKQRFTPRRQRSMWSKTNREHVARLIKEKKMMAAGLRQIEAAKRDGRWDHAYDPSATMKIPADFMAALSKDKKAAIFFETLNRANLYAIGWRLQTAKKPETRVRRMASILAQLKAGKKFH